VAFQNAFNVSGSMTTLDTNPRVTTGCGVMALGSCSLWRRQWTCPWRTWYIHLCVHFTIFGPKVV